MNHVGMIINAWICGTFEIYHKGRAKITHISWSSSPPLKSLAHNKYQVAGRQLLLFITLDQIKPSSCFFCQPFLLNFSLRWSWSESESFIKLSWSAAVMISYNRIALVGFRKLSFLSILASHWQHSWWWSGLENKTVVLEIVGRDCSWFNRWWKRWFLVQWLVINQWAGSCSQMLDTWKILPSRTHTSLPLPLFWRTWFHPHRSFQLSSSWFFELYSSCFHGTHPGKLSLAPICETDSHSPSGTVSPSFFGSLGLSHSSGLQIPSCTYTCSCPPPLESTHGSQFPCIDVRRNHFSSSLL